MTNSERLYVANDLISKLNTPACIREIGRECENMGAMTLETLKVSFPNVPERELEKISERVMEKAKACGYPENKIPRASATLNCKEILWLTDLSKEDIIITEWTLRTIGNLMQDNDDERATELLKAVTVVNQILLSQHERRGENL